MKIAVLPGDGIGPGMKRVGTAEIGEAVVAALERV